MLSSSFASGGRVRLAAILLLCLLPPAVFAQGTSVLIGSVVDASTKKPLLDVVVTATSPALQGEQVVVTDAAGQYRISQLPSGTYTLRLEKEGYKPYSRGDISIRLDLTIRVNVELLPETLAAEEVVVVGRAPTIDVGSTNTGISIGADLVRNIAVVRPGTKGSGARSFESLAELAPGANADIYGVSINGTTSPENNFVIDGLTVNDPGFGILGTPLSIDFVQEVNVITGGYMPEYGRATGGIINVVTKSGSNEFHGSVFGTLTPGALEAGRPQIVAEGQTITSRQALWNLGDFGAELGGPILKDKLWFYAGFSPSFSRYQFERHLNVIQTDALGNPLRDERGLTLTRPIDGTQSFRFADSKTFQYIGKLTYLVNPDHRLSLSVYGTPTNSGGNGAYGFNSRNGLPQVTSPITGTSILGTYEALANQWFSFGNDVIGKWSSSFLEKRFLLDASLGWHHQQESRLAPDGSELGSDVGLAGTPQVIYRRAPSFHPITDFESIPDPSVCGPRGSLCPVTGYTLGGPGFTYNSLLERFQGRVVGTYLLQAAGHHVIKTGIDVDQSRYRQTKAYSGTVQYREALNGTNFTDLRQYGYLVVPDQVVIQNQQSGLSISNTVGGFVQDSWNVLDLVTLNAGMRYDAQWLVGNDKRTAIKLLNEWSPRIGVIYDFTKAGRSKIFASYARYFESVPLDMIDRAFPAERRVSSTKRFPACNPADLTLARTACQSDANRIPNTAASEPNRVWSARGGGGEAVDTNLKAQSSDELVFGGEYEVIPDGRFGAVYTRRYMNHVIEDMSRDEATTYFIGNPGEGIAKDFPKATRDYDAVTVYFTKAFTSLWLAQVSYTWSTLRGNYPGLFRPETGQLDPNINSDFDLISLMANRSGPLTGDRTHAIKVFGAKEFVLTGSLGFNIGLSYRGISGAPLNVLGSHNIYGFDEVFILPRGAAGRLPWVHTMDSHVGVNYRLARNSVLTVGLDVFNLFNFSGVTGRDQRYTRADVLPIENGTQADLPGKVVSAADGSPLPPDQINPNYGNIQAYQDPRRIRFNARVSF
jgi:hypothetical protein